MEADHFNAQFWDDLPDLSHEQVRAVLDALRWWCQIKAEYESRWNDEQQALLRQLDADLWHSALLYRMLHERKKPLSDPPPLDHSYPIYERKEGV